jgi:hypothetical protein
MLSLSPSSIAISLTLALTAVYINLHVSPSSLSSLSLFSSLSKEPISHSPKDLDRHATMTDYRLPTSVRPTHYELAVRTDLAASPPRFEAEVTISLEVLEDTPTVVFHMHPSLSVTHLALHAGVTQELPVFSLSTDEEKERATVSLAQPLKKGEAKLFVRYEAELNGNMMGYYRSNSDPDANGKRLV